MPEHWKTLLAKTRKRFSNRDMGIDHPILGVIESIQTETERVQVDAGGGGPTRVTHPYVSIRSWQRIMPEEETAVVVTTRGDTAEAEIAYYWSGAPEARVARYRGGVGYYRPLDRGEFETTSYGLSQIYGSRNGNLDLRGGIVRQWLSNTNLEHGSKAHTYVRQLHDHNHSVVRGEERFGIVWRNGADFTKRIYPKVDGVYAKEHIRVISFGGHPGILCDTREGHVHEDDGVRAISPAQRPLRKRDIWFTSSGTSGRDMIDDDGNRWWLFPDTAVVGGLISVPKGPFQLRTGGDIAFASRKDITATATNNMIIRVGTLLHLEGDVEVKIISKGAIILDAGTVQINGRVVASNSSPI